MELRMSENRGSTAGRRCVRSQKWRATAREKSEVTRCVGVHAMMMHAEKFGNLAQRMDDASLAWRCGR